MEAFNLVDTLDRTDPLRRVLFEGSTIEGVSLSEDEKSAGSRKDMLH